MCTELGWDHSDRWGEWSTIRALLPMLNHGKVILAEDLDQIHLANVRDGMKLWRLYEALEFA